MKPRRKAANHSQSYRVDARVTANHDIEAARSDVELVAAINRGDAAAFEVLYFRHREWVAGLAYRFTGDSDASLDVMQETFLYLLRKFPGFRLTANLKTFLYPAVRNLSIAARRKAARYQATTAELEQLERAPAPPPAGTEAADLQWDVNGDGVVDERDVATLAARAVRLGKGGRS